MYKHNIMVGDIIVGTSPRGEGDLVSKDTSFIITETDELWIKGKILTNIVNRESIGREYILSLSWFEAGWLVNKNIKYITPLSKLINKIYEKEKKKNERSK